jgi:BirA family biotin operon repressor/biotin-[acetyl-CoA-carboxylase] ligase
MSQPSATTVALLRLLADGEWHSGVALATQLRLTRAAVWKQMQALVARGVAVQSRRTGYRLDGALDLLDPPRLQAQLTRAGIGEPLEVFDSLPSTNARLVARIAAGQGGGVCVAEHQSAGRGRRGRAWHSPFGQNLYLSISQPYEVGPAALAGLSLAIGTALAQLLAGLGAAAVGIKWPNDLLCRGRKLGGILIELQGDTQGPCWAVVGIGINVNMLADDSGLIDQPWTSLAQETGRAWDRSALAAQVIAAVHAAMAGFPAQGLAPWLNAYARFDLLAGRVIDVDWAGERIAGVACGIDGNGALLVDCDGARRALWGGEVTVRAGRESAA